MWVLKNNGPEQTTTFRRRENYERNFHKADFGLRILRADLTAPNRGGISPGSPAMELIFSQRADSNRD